MTIEPAVTPAERPIAGGKAQALAWYGVLIGPFAWKLQLMLNYALTPYACWHRAEYLNHIASVLMFVVALSGAWAGWKTWQRAGANIDVQFGGPLGRTRFLGLAGVLLSSYLAVMIVAQWIPNVVLGACDGIQ